MLIILTIPLIRISYLIILAKMKVHQFGRSSGLMFDHDHDNAPSLSLACKRLRPLAPNLARDGGGAITISPPAFDLKSFIKPESSSPTKLGSPDSKKDSPHQAAVETHPGGTRWNPTQEQIGILEMLYRGGVRTPNAQQIEQITAQLGKYGKIEGKNVFYWFQNHKARERQKQKRNTAALLSGPTTPPPTSLTLDPIMVVVGREEESSKKRRCRSWAVEFLELEEKKSSCCRREEGDRTLELFPLHPELGR